MNQYVRDPAGVVGQDLQAGLETDARLPDSARFTGISNGDVQLWLDPGTVDEFVFVTDGATVERWPRANPPALCA